MKNIAVFASHGGSNLQAVIDAISEGRLIARIGAVISNNSTSFALERARRAGIPAYHISTKTENSEEAVAEKMLSWRRTIPISFCCWAICVCCRFRY